MIEILKKLLFLFPATDKWKLVGLLVLMLIGSLLEVVGIGMIPVFISIVANPDRVLELEAIRPILDFLNIEDAEQLLVFGGIALVLTFLVKNSYMIGFHYIKAVFLYNRYANLSGRLFHGYMNSPYSFMLTKNSSEILRNVAQETGFVINNVITPYLKLAMDIVLILATFILLFLVNPLITLAAILSFGLAGGGFLRMIRGKSQRYGRKSHAERMVMIQAVNEGVGGLKDIRVLQRAGWFLQRFNGSVSRYARALIFRYMTRHSTKPVLETVAVAGMLLVALGLHWQGRSLDTIIPLLALFGAAAMRLLPAIREIVEAVNSLRFYGHSVHAIHDELRRLEEMGKVPASLIQDDGEVFEFKRDIQFQSVHFSYSDPSCPAITNLSLQILKGKTVGLIGPSGSGKTTIVDLLLGILEPQQGEVLVDGVNIRDVPKAWLRNVGYIPQFIFLTDNTLKRNIAFGLQDQEIDEGRLASAIEAAQLSETVNALPDGLETVVGERGVRFSGGQRQRIGIARALYGNPNVLIMDEATSALDSETEREVLQSIEKLKGERTIIMISHRMSTVENSDTIFLINEGRVTDSGKYQYIVKRNWEICQARG